MTTFCWLIVLAVYGFLCTWWGARDGEDRGFKRGHEEGYRAGLLEFSNYLKAQESLVDEERQKMWKEGL